jgi:hypothetical protein
VEFEINVEDNKTFYHLSKRKVIRAPATKHGGQIVRRSGARR